MIIYFSLKAYEPKNQLTTGIKKSRDGARLFVEMLRKKRTI